jgi:Tfp pilus assembly protein PilZ
LAGAAIKPPPYPADQAAVDPRPKPGIDKRRHRRHVRRIRCELFIRGTRYGGIVKDVSRGGVFVNTRAKASIGTAITIVIPPGEGRTEIRFTGRVVRSDRVSARLAMQSAAGIGVEVLELGALGRLIGDPRLAMSESKPKDD